MEAGKGDGEKTRGEDGSTMCVHWRGVMQLDCIS